jgi:hypothetical protein
MHQGRYLGRVGSFEPVRALKAEVACEAGDLLGGREGVAFGLKDLNSLLQGQAVDSFTLQLGKTQQSREQARLLK